MSDCVDSQAFPTVLIAGVHQSTDAYPNTLYRVSHLKESFGALELNEPLWKAATDGISSTRSPLRSIVRALVAHGRLVWRVATSKRMDIAYIPYPAIGVALPLSWLPRRFRPTFVVVDAFISIYDTIVNDRKLWKPGALRSKLMWLLERAAFRVADIVLVDTPQNADFYSDLFRLPRNRFVVLPLATNESDYTPKAYLPVIGRCRVLFVGTLVPLHGIETIAVAARLLSDRKDVQFRILGDGADAPKLKTALEGAENVDWQRRWFTASELANEIADSDICLGIFGGTEKAQRVCPYKLYAYSRVGRATITGDTQWLQSLESGEGNAPFFSVPVMDAHALASAVRKLADAPAQRELLARAASDFHERHLSNALSFQALDTLLFDAFAAQKR